jgi:hypothetical protein
MHSAIATPIVAFDKCFKQDSLFSILPDEMLTEIFSFLDDYSKTIVSRVCKRFLSLIIYEDREHIVRNPFKMPIAKYRRIVFAIRGYRNKHDSYVSWHTRTIDRIDVPRSVKYVRFASIYPNVLRLTCPPLTEVEIAGAVNREVFKCIREMKSKVNVIVSKIFIDNLKWNLSDSSDMNLGLHKNFLEMPSDRLHIMLEKYLALSDLQPEIVDLSSFKSKSYNIEISDSYCGLIPSIEIKLPEHTESLEIEDDFFDGKITFTVPHSLRVLRVKCSGRNHIEIKHNGADIRLDELYITEFNNWEPTGVLRNLWSLYDERFSCGDVSKLTALEIKTLCIKTDFVSKEFFTILQKVLYNIPIQELRLIFLCSDKKILRDGTEEYVDFNKRGRYMLIMPEKLKKLYIHYQFTEVMLRIACKRSLLRKVELIPEPRSRRCRKLRFIES